MHTVFLLLGSNMGNREKLLSEATRLIAVEAGTLVAQSSLYESPPWGFEASESFLNQVLKIKTALHPLNLLKKLLSIEKRLGRKRSEGKTGYESRTIDIDILLYDDLTVKSSELELPHPRLPIRCFALTPLAEIAPELKHPSLGKTITELLAKCPDTNPVHKFQPHI